jgi:hypothetical protein
MMSAHDQSWLYRWAPCLPEYGGRSESLRDDSFKWEPPVGMPSRLSHAETLLPPSGFELELEVRPLVDFYTMRSRS